jgi:hypothetical protein
MASELQPGLLPHTWELALELSLQLALEWRQELAQELIHLYLLHRHLEQQVPIAGLTPIFS